MEQTSELAGPRHTWKASISLRGVRDLIREDKYIDDIQEQLHVFIDDISMWPPHEEDSQDGYYFEDDRTPPDEITDFANRLLRYYDLLDEIKRNAFAAPRSLYHDERDELETLIFMVFEELLVRYGRGVRPREEFSLDDVPSKWGSEEDEEQEKQDPLGSHQDTEAWVSSLGDAMNGMAMVDGSDNDDDGDGDDSDDEGESPEGGSLTDEDEDVVMT